MKCEKCNKNEANVFYRTSVNGQVTEQHLCSECAREMGLDRAFEKTGRDFFDRAFDGFFGGDSLMSRFFGGDSLMDDFFGGSMLPSFGGTMLMPRLRWPRIEISADSAPQEQKTEEVSDEKTEELKSRREVNALREQLKAAVEAEDFEKAIELRDKLRELEK